MTRTTPFAVLILLPLIAGCGTARLVRSTPRGGELALSGSYSASAEQARLLMAEHCDGPYAIRPTAEGGDALYPSPAQERVTFVCTHHGRAVAKASAGELGR